MGALSGSASYLRCAVDGRPGRSAREAYVRRLKHFRFRALSPDGEMQSVGWVPAEAPYDDDMALSPDRFWFSENIVLALREDRIVLPRPLVRHLVDKRVDALRAEGRPAGRNARRREEDEVIFDLKKRALPRTRIVVLVWDTERERARVFGRGTIVSEKLIPLFERTFELPLREVTYGRRAFDLNLGTRAKSVLERLGPGGLLGQG